MPHLVQLGPYPPPEGGVTRNLIGIRDEALRRGWAASVIATTKCPVSGDDDKDVHRPRGPVALTSRLRSLAGDIAHLHIGGEVTPRVMALAATVAAVAGRRSVLTIHSGSFPLSARSRAAVRRSLRGTIFRRFGHIIAVNAEIDEVLDRYGVAANRRSVISPFLPARPDLDASVSPEIEHFLRSHSHIFLSIGGLQPEYDPAFQLEAFSRLKRCFPNSGLIMVGGGPMLQTVKEQLKPSGDDRDIFLTGPMPHSVTLLLISAATLLLRTTKFDGDAISVREAIHLGTPVVASDVSVRPAAAITYRAGDVEDFVDAVKKAIETPPAAASGEEDGHNVERVFAIYGSLISGR